jgi:type 2 lantibiotic biosynthesis protein LanM
MEPLDPALVAIHRSALFQHERTNGTTAGGEIFPEPLNHLPNWVQILRRTMSTLPSTEKGKWADLPFGDILVGFIATGQELLGIRCPKSLDGLSMQAVASLQRALGESVAEVIDPCLLSEFAFERPAGAGILGIFAAELAPSIGTERYQLFVERHRADGLRQILTKFPVAGRLAAMRIETWVEATSELLDRLAGDLPEIKAELLQSTEEAFVSDIDPRLSDPHCRGRSVAIVTFSDGRKVVYKPRSLAPEAAWRTLVSTLEGDHAQLSARVMDRGAYGWMEHIAARDADEVSDVRAFYRSAGSLLCLARAFSLKDLHFENVVAAGSRPVVIDLEALAQPCLRSVPTSALDRIAATRERLLANSVQATEALHVRYSVSDRPPIDISAFADMRTATRRRAVWSGLGTDAIALSFEEEPIPATNLPRRQGVVQRGDEFLEDILAGFEETWLALAQARPNIMRAGGIVDAISAMPVRFIIRPTEIYYRILAKALAPENLHSGIDYSYAFEALNLAAGPDEPPEFRRIAAAEIEALHRGDIPRFTVAVAGSAVYDDNACVAEDLLDLSGVETIRRRMDSLTMEQLDVERRIIRASFGAARWGTGAAPAAKLNLVTSPLSGDEAVEAALSIGRSIAGEADLRSDGGCSWIGVAYDHSSTGPAALTLNESLYEGTTGVGVFLAALFRATGEQSWAVLAESALTDARRIVRETPAEERPATVAHFGRGLGGFGGLVYGLALAADFLKSEEVRNDAGRLASWMEADTAAAHAETDLLGGDIGALPGLLALGVSIDARTAIRRCCNAHQQPDLPSSVRGFGHGSTGAAATLALVAESALDAERLFAMAERSADIPRDGELPDGPVGWCKGPVGEALARLALNARLSKVEPQDIAGLERAIGEAVATPHALDQLCCGLFGAVEAFLVAARHGRGDLSEAAGILARALIARANESGGFRLLAGLPAGVGGVGLFQGMSGIGYTLLRLARPQSFPSILMTEWRT